MGAASYHASAGAHACHYCNSITVVLQVAFGLSIMVQSVFLQDSTDATRIGLLDADLDNFMLRLNELAVESGAQFFEVCCIIFMSFNAISLL